MAAKLNPYITFKDTAREAMEFYRDVFGGELTLSTFGEFGHPDEALADKVMHAMLETPSGFTLMASDTAEVASHRPGDTIAISVSGDDADELRRYWARLSEGGTVSVPMEKQMWGDEFGQCTDRFGIGWLIDIEAAAG